MVRTSSTPKPPNDHSTIAVNSTDPFPDAAPVRTAIRWWSDLAKNLLVVRPSDQALSRLASVATIATLISSLIDQLVRHV